MALGYDNVDYTLTFPGRKWWVMEVTIHTLDRKKVAASRKFEAKTRESVVDMANEWVETYMREWIALQNLKFSGYTTEIK